MMDASGLVDAHKKVHRTTQLIGSVPELRTGIEQEDNASQAMTANHHRIEDQRTTWWWYWWRLNKLKLLWKIAK